MAATTARGEEGERDLGQTLPRALAGRAVPRREPGRGGASHSGKRSALTREAAALGSAARPYHPAQGGPP